MAPALFGRLFTLWERTTSAYLDTLARSPLLLGAAGNWIGWSLLAKRLSDSGVHTLLTTLGLATRRDQERALHLLQQIEGRLDDLELRLNGAGRP